MMRNNAVKIAVTGPESTAKSTLCALLAQYYKTSFAKEFAREYLGVIQREIVVEDIQLMHDMQLRLEAKAAFVANQLYFCDTDIINFKIWLQEVFHVEPDWIKKSLLDNTYDLYLLCYPDIEWEPDGIRANEHNRDFLFEQFHQELIRLKRPFVIIIDEGESRLQCCIEAVDQFMSGLK